MREKAYPYLRGDGVPVASPLFQGEGSGSIPTSPLQFSFREASLDDVLGLTALWHSRLPKVDRSICSISPYAWYVAEFENGLYAAAIWTKPMARMLNDRPWIELRRMAIGPEAPRNTALRMLAWMVKDIRRKFPYIERAISYQDTAVHFGTIYKASNWIPTILSREGDAGWSERHGSGNREQSTSAKQRWELPL